MKAPRPCDCEADVLDAVAAGRVQRVAAHLAVCRECRDTVLVALAMASERDAAANEVTVPPPEVVWYGARLRARAEAARAAARPVFVVQAIAVACLAGMIAALAGTGAWWLDSWVEWLTSTAATVATAHGTVELTTLAVRGVLLALAVWLAIVPVALYLVVAEEP